jgi:dUTP pyrophosphatase
MKVDKVYHFYFDLLIISKMSEEFELSSDEEVPQGSGLLAGLMGGFMEPKMSSSTPLERGTRGSAGYDFKSIVSIIVPPKVAVTIETGISLALTPGYYMQLYTRSSIALRGKIVSSSGVTCTTESVIVLAGVIDSDYTGTVKVILYNLGNTNYVVKVGDKIAQGIIHKYHTFENEVIIKDETFEHTGFGSTTATDSRGQNSYGELIDSQLTGHLID